MTITHPNFDPKQTPIDPARPLADIPEPAPRTKQPLHRLYAQTVPTSLAVPMPSWSKWQLVQSPAFAQYLALLTAGGLVALPQSFYQPAKASSPALLSSLEHVSLIDMADIYQAVQAYPNLTRYGFAASPQTEAMPAHDADELLNSDYSNDWQVLLLPQKFDSGQGSLLTDILPCSVAVHILKQCEQRQSPNHRYTVSDITEHMRSYLLSQCQILPQKRQQIRQIRLFAGHVVVAAHHLGWQTQVQADGSCYLNISSRSGLLTRYPNMLEFDVHGWWSGA